jgi:predicted nuclease of restriction endonuclease-like (RecB) superfamily
LKIKSLFQSVKALIEKSRSQVARNVNTVIIHTYFYIGRTIIHEQQKGNERAEYAEEIIAELSKSLSAAYGKGFSKRNLDYFK